MPRVYLALSRHGSYEQPAGVPSAHLPYGLTEDGEEQVNLLIEDVLDFARQHDCALDPVIDASPLLRAWETATIAARRITRDFGFDLRVQEHAALTERCLGSLANLTIDAIEQVVAADPRFDPPPADWKASADYRLPVLGAESLAEAGDRVAAHLHETARAIAHSAKRDTLKIVVGHGGSIRHAAATLKVLDRQAVRGLSMHHCRPVFWQWSDADVFSHVAGEWKVRGEQLD